MRDLIQILLEPMKPKSVPCSGHPPHMLLWTMLALTTSVLGLQNTKANPNPSAFRQAGSIKTEQQAGATRTTVAVMRWQPVDERTFSPQDFHWLQTFTDLVHDDLRQISALKVVEGKLVVRELARMRYNDPTNLTPSQGFQMLGERLEANWVIQGAMAHQDGSWTIKMLIFKANGHAMGKTWTASNSNMFKLRDQAVEHVLQQLNVTASVEERERLGKPWTTSPDAFELGSRGAFFFYEQHFQSALDLLRKAVAEDPLFVQARGFLAGTLYNLGEDDEAFRQARQALNQGADDFLASQLHLLAANVLIQQDRLDEADEEVVEGLRARPENTDLLLLQATLRKAVDDLNGATASLRAAAIFDPRNPNIQARLAELGFLRGEATNAFEHLDLAEALLQEVPGPVDYETELALADAYNSSGNLPKALQHYRCLLAAADDARLSEVRIRAIRAKVQKLERRSEPVRVDAVRPRVYSAAELWAALEQRLSPDEMAQVVNPIECTPTMARWAREIVGDTQGDLERARKLFDQLVLRPYVGVGSTHTAQEVFAAWDDLSRPFSCQEYAKLYVALARSVGLSAFFVYVVRDYADTIVDHACAVVFVQGGAWLVDPAYDWFGVPHLEFRVLDDLQTVANHIFQPHHGAHDVALCRAGLKLDPDSVYGRRCLVRALIVAGQFDAAREELDVLRSSLPEDWDGYELEGLLACEQTRFDEALDWLTKAREANPASGDTRLLLAETLFRFGQQAAARREFEAGLRRGHDSFGADLARRRLRVLDEAVQQGTNAAGGLEPAADAGSYFELGRSFLSGPSPDASEAAKWFQKSADLGFAEAQDALGFQYWTGQGVPLDPAKAVDWWRKAADQGDPQSMRNLSAAYRVGVGVPKNAKEALLWLRRAAEAGDAHAQMMLGKAYYKGEPAPRDLTEALFWLMRAGEAVDTVSPSMIAGRSPAHLERQTRALLNEVELFATPEEIAAATARFKNCQAAQASENGSQ